MSEMQECLHEEECRRREVRLGHLQDVTQILTGCPLLSQMPLLPEQCQCYKVVCRPWLPGWHQADLCASPSMALRLGRRVGAKWWAG